MEKIDSTIFRDGEILVIVTRTRKYGTTDYQLGFIAGTNMLAAVEKASPSRVHLIPIGAVQELVVDYGDVQATVQNTTPA